MGLGMGGHFCWMNQGQRQAADTRRTSSASEEQNGDCGSAAQVMAVLTWGRWMVTVAGLATRPLWDQLLTPTLFLSTSLLLSQTTLISSKIDSYPRSPTWWPQTSLPTHRMVQALFFTPSSPLLRHKLYTLRLSGPPLWAPQIPSLRKVHHVAFHTIHMGVQTEA